MGARLMARYEAARQAVAALPARSRPAFLPLAVVPAYAAARTAAQRGATLSDVSPLSRIWALGLASIRGLPRGAGGPTDG